MKAKKVKSLLLLATLTGVISLSMVGCSSTKGSEDKTETSSTTDATGGEVVEDVVLKVGDTWEVDGQWKLTINSVKATEERSEYADSQPSAVYVIDYTYENIGYEDDIMDGLYIELSSGQIVDSQGKMGYPYPGNITNYPAETPVGASCDAETTIGVDNPGNFKLTCIQYDGNDEKQKATFDITVE